MTFKSLYIDELLHIRNVARENRNWALSDEIRKYLDQKGVFVFDSDKGQIVYHRRNSSREKIILQLKKEARAQKLFDAWLHSINESIQKKAC